MMSLKRRNTSSPEASPSPPRKRALSPAYYIDADSVDGAQDSKEKPRVDALFGQTGAFPGLGGGVEEEPFYGPANDGIGYLRMVRSEARGVPNLLVAPSRIDSAADIENEENGNGGHWEEETFIGAPQPASSSPTTQLSVAQLRYYELLLTQFRLLQATLRCTPPLEAVQALPSDRLISFPADSQQAATRWEKQVLTSDPSMVQMACMDTDSVWELVRKLGEMLSKIQQSPQRLGAWAWACLGRCPDLGMCHSEEVGDLRTLARTAAALIHAESIDEDHGEEELAAGDEHGSEANRQEPSGQDMEWASSETALDMIITIIGEIYGQRDLLEQRRIWQRSGS